MSEPEPPATPDATPPRRSWWHSLRPGTRRGLRGTVAFLVTGLIALVFGVTTASYDGSLGPHVARYSTTLNHEITVDMGPLGAVIIDSPLPAGLGVDVLVQEIPDSLLVDGRAVPAGPDNALAGLTADLGSYTQFLANPEATIRTAAWGLVRDAGTRIVFAWTVLIGLIILGRLAAHGVLRSAASSAWRQPGVPVVAITLVLAVGTVTLFQATRGSEGAGRPSTVLAGTPLANARITGRLGAIVDHYGSYVVKAIQENKDFYDAVEANLRQAYADDPAPTEPVRVPAPVPVVAGPEPEQPTDDLPDLDLGQPTDPATPGDGTPPAQATAEPGTPTGAEPTEGEGAVLADPSDPVAADESEAAASPDGLASATATGEPTQAASPTPSGPATPTPAPTPTRAEPDPVVLVQVSDLHCNVGMAGVIGATADLAGADLIVNTGDTVMAGTSVENYCVNAFADAFGKRPVVVADGNHDSEDTARQEARRGWTVLRGEPVEVAGITFLGDVDPTLSSLGVPTHQVGPESVAEMGARLASTACEAGGVDILAIHQPRAAVDPLRSGCVTLDLSGHYHRRIGPWQRGLGLQYISASTAGATENKPTIGPLSNPGTITVIRWDRANREPMDFRTVTANPDRSVTLSEWYRFPERPTERVELPMPGPGEGPW